MSTEPRYPLSYVPVDSTAPRSVGTDYLPDAPASATGPAPFVFPGTEEVDPAYVFAGPGYRSPTPPYSLWARLSLVCALFGFIPALSFVAIALGHYALYDMKNSRRSGRGIATAGLAIGYMVSVIWILVLILRIVNS